MKAGCQKFQREFPQHAERCHHHLGLQPLLAEEALTSEHHCRQTLSRLAWIPDQSVRQSLQMAGLAGAPFSRQLSHFLDWRANG